LSLCLLDPSSDTWIGIKSDGSIDCHGLEDCDGEQLWVDGSNFNGAIFNGAIFNGSILNGSNFNLSFFSEITDIHIYKGHRCVFYLNLVTSM
jgi:hypothetical protein